MQFSQPTDALERRRRQNRMAQRKFRNKNSSANLPKKSDLSSPASPGTPIRPRHMPGTAPSSPNTAGKGVSNAAARNTTNRTQDQSPVSQLSQSQSHFYTAPANQSRSQFGTHPKQQLDASNYQAASPGHSAKPQNNMIDPTCLPVDSFQNIMMQTLQTPSTPGSPTSQHVHAKLSAVDVSHASTVPASCSWDLSQWNDLPQWNGICGVGTRTGVDDMNGSGKLAWGPTPPVQQGDTSDTSTSTPQYSQTGVSHSSCSHHSINPGSQQRQQQPDPSELRNDCDQDGISDHESECDQDEPHQSALHIAAEGGHEVLVDMLLDSGLAVDVLDSEAETPLHRASRHARAVVGRKLLQRGANPNSVNLTGWTPVHLAVSAGSVDLVKVLVEHGGDISKKARGGIL